MLHFVNADPARTPTFALFAKPDYFLSTGSATCTTCVTQNPSFAWDHGDYAPEVNTNYVGFVGPGVKNLGLDGPDSSTGPNSSGPNSGQGTVPDATSTGTWVDETDIRPTELYLVGLHDDYVSDGRVISPIVDHLTAALRAPGVEALAVCYKQLNSSVGTFGTYTLQADTAAIETSSASDATYLTALGELRALEVARDHLATHIKRELSNAAFNDVPVFGAAFQTAVCHGLIDVAKSLAG
jgi:hypothetical protein